LRRQGFLAKKIRTYGQGGVKWPVREGFIGAFRVYFKGLIKKFAGIHKGFIDKHFLKKLEPVLRKPSVSKP
jgi:hypothetical protein